MTVPAESVLQSDSLCLSPTDRDWHAIAKPELLYPEAFMPEWTRPAGSGNLARFQQDTSTLVLLYG